MSRWDPPKDKEKCHWFLNAYLQEVFFKVWIRRKEAEIYNGRGHWDWLDKPKSLKISHSDLALGLSWIACAGILFESVVFVENQMLAPHILSLKEGLYWPFTDIFYLNWKNTTKPSTWWVQNHLWYMQNESLFCSKSIKKNVWTTRL